jgi:hypothetical protein
MANEFFLDYDLCLSGFELVGCVFVLSLEGEVLTLLLQQLPLVLLDHLLLDPQFTLQVAYCLLLLF